MRSSEDFVRARDFCEQRAHILCGQHTFLSASRYTPDAREFETCFAIGERDLQAVTVVKRSHFSWDLWGVRLLAVDPGAPRKDTLIQELLDVIKRHVQTHASTDGTILALSTQSPETFAAFGWQPLLQHRAPISRTVMLHGLDSRLEMLPLGPARTEEQPSALTQVSVRTLSEEEIGRARVLADEAWDRETGEMFVEENTRFLREGAIVCGALLDTNFVGAGTIHRTCFDQDLWGLAWGVVQSRTRSQGIGSAMTQFRLNSAALQSPEGSAIIVTPRPEHALRNGFLAAARYGQLAHKWILTRSLGTTAR